ncbi:MAG: glycosyltransferase family 39 protein [Caldilineaceae bacterium]|nr:glycosyltransferase family 39 protein [Caldilineaceae bacterium]
MLKTSRMRAWQWLLLVAALTLFAAQAGWSSTQKSAAFDEQYHLAAGYSYLRTGDFRLATNHPPLAGLLAALPLLADNNIVLPAEHPAWEASDRFLFSDVFLWESNLDPQGILLRARWPITVLGVLLVACLFFAARQMLGARAGWLVLLLATFEPNLIAHARFVTTDLALTLFIFVGAWWWWRWLVQPRWHNLVVAGLAAGLAMGTKYNGAMIWPILLFVALILPVLPGYAGIRKRLWSLPAAGLAALVVLWLLYHLDVGPVSFLPGWLILPAPYYWQWFWNTVFRILELQGARVDFFFGEASNQGWWHYFFVASAVKLTLPTLLLAFAGLVLLVRRRAARQLAILWIPPLFFLLLGATQVLNIGFRHMLAAVPFILLLAAYVAEALPWLYAPARRSVIAGALLLFWVLADTGRIAPHYESHFNQLAGPWQNWSNILVDSNLDWGQDLPALRRTMEELGIETVNLAYFGKATPETYGIRYRPLPSYLRFMEGREISAFNPYTPEPGWYAISATELRAGTLQPETVDLYRVFRTMEPVARAGYSIYLYNLDYPAGTEVVRPAVLNEPLWTKSPAELGLGDGQRGAVKWLETTDSTIYPQGVGFVAPVDPPFQPVNADFGGVFTLLGYSQDRPSIEPGQVLHLTLYWQAGDRPMPQPAPTRGAPLSAFVHVVDGDPAAKVAEYDSWNVALRGLEPGDIIAQQVVLGFADGVAPKRYDMLVGLYSPQDWSRLTVETSQGTVVSVRAGTVEVQQ